MTEKEALKQLELAKVRYCNDREILHIRSDLVLLEFLESQGHTDIVNFFKELQKGFYYS